MAFVPGKNTVIQLDNLAGTPVDISAYADSVSGLDAVVAMLDTTAFGSSAITMIPGLKGGSSIGINGKFDQTLNIQVSAIYASQTVSSTLTVHWDGTASGKPKMSCECWVENYAPSSAVGDLVTWSLNLKQTGDVTFATN